MQLDWNTIKAEYSAGSKLRELAEKYNTSFETVKTHHKTDKWAIARKEFKNIVFRKTTEKKINKAVEKEFNEIETVIDSILWIDEQVKSGNCTVMEASSLIDKKDKLLNTLGKYTQKTVERHAIEHNYIDESFKKARATYLRIKGLEEERNQQIVSIRPNSTT